MRRCPMSLLLLWVLPAIGSAQAPALPNGTLAIGYRHREDGKLGVAVYRLELSCWDDSCTMTTLTLNQCMGVPDGEAFYPTVEHTGTVEGTLEVQRTGPGALTILESYGGSQLRYRVNFTVREDSALAARLRMRQTLFFKGITAFSGAATKVSPALKRAVSYDLVPLRRGQEIVRLRCGVYLEAIR